MTHVSLCLGNHRVDKDEFFTDFSQKVGLLEEKLDFVFNELDVDHNRYLNSFDTNALFYLSDRDGKSICTQERRSANSMLTVVRALDEVVSLCICSFKKDNSQCVAI